MEYPRQLVLDQDTKERLISYLDEELTNHYAERHNYIEDLKRWQKDYWSKPRTEKATFPFSGAANIVIPLSAIAVETIHARFMTTLFGLKQFVSGENVDPSWEPAVRPVERFMDDELLNRMKIRPKMEDLSLEMVKYGTTIGKTGYERIIKYAVRGVGDEEQEFPVVVKHGPTLDCVSGSRFLMPFPNQDPQMSPWVGEEHEKTPYEVKLLCESGYFRPEAWQELEGWVAQQNVGPNPGSGEFRHQQEQLENRVPHWPKYLYFTEIWLSFDVAKSGNAREIQVFYHKDSRTFLSIRYNWYEDLHRPYRKAVYFPVEHRWNGVGVCKQNEQFQREVTTQHRQRLDNATLANMRMIKIKKLSGYGPGEPVFPGKMWFVDDIADIDTFQMGEIYPSAYNNEATTLQYSQQRTGVNDAIMGMPQAGTPGTATAELSRVQEGNKKFDYSYANFKSLASQLVVDIACEIAQFGPRNVQYYNRAQDGNLVQQFFSLPSEFIRDGLVIKLKAAGQLENKIIDRQNWTQLAPLIQQYYTALIQLAMGSGMVQLIPIITQRGLSAATEAMRQILESYDVRNIDRIIVREFEALLHGATPNSGIIGTPNQGLIGAGGPAGMGQPIIPSTGGF